VEAAAKHLMNIPFLVQAGHVFAISLDYYINNFVSYYNEVMIEIIQSNIIFMLVKSL
jgi:hypothetical protein